MATWKAIFCPSCGELVLDAERCPACGNVQPDAAVEPGTLIWQTETGHALPRPRCYPVLAAGQLCVPSDTGRIVAVNATTGIAAWEHTLPEASAAYTLDSDGAHVFVGSYDTRAVPKSGRALLALDAASGELAWSFASASHSFSGPTVLGELVYVTSSDGKLQALECASGKLYWSQPHADWGPSALAANDTVVIAGGRGNLLLGYDAHDGHELWRFQGGGWFATRPALVDGLVAARCWDGYLYGLDARSGALRWKATGERGAGFTSPPAAAPGLILIGDRVVIAGKNGYALRALRSEDGAERWRHATDKHVSALPAAAADLILCPTEGQELLALSPDDGALRWRVALTADLTGCPVLADEHAYLADEAGRLSAVRTRNTQLQQRSPDALLAAGDRAGAAAAFVLSGDLISGALLYGRLAMPAAAARVYEHAAFPGQAAPYWEQAGEQQRARDAYRAAGDLLGLAQHLANNGELLEAARIYEEQGRLSNAAPLYEQAGDKARAAELYRQVGRLAAARRTDAELGYWEHQAERLIADEQFAEAAALIAENGQLERAAVLYEQAGKLADALLIRLDLQHWERAADLAMRVGDLEHAAEAYVQIGQKQRAAELYAQAAAQSLAAPAADARLAASLYERAAKLYAEIFDTEQANACAREVRRHRMLPELQVAVSVEQEFVEQEWSTATVTLHNIGFGAARSIQLRAPGRFELGDAPVLAGIAPNREANLIVSLRPLAGELGRVPLSLAVAYLDGQELAYEARAQSLVRVLPKGADPARSTHSPLPAATLRPQREQGAAEEVVLTLRFDRDGDEVEISWEADIIGVRPSRFAPPFVGPDLDLVVRALDRLQYPSTSLLPTETARLGVLGLPVVDGGLAELGHRAVGRALYQALVADPRGAQALGTVRDHARHEGLALALRLRLPPDAIELAALPWELLWDAGQAPLLLGHSQLSSCTRHLDLGEALPPPRPRSGALRILAITPHAGSDPDQRERERAERTSTWAPLIANGDVVIEAIGPATRRALVDRMLSGPPPDIIHFVGHGRYADGEGWLVLDRPEPDGQWDRVPASQLPLLFGDTRLVVLCACQGGMVGEGGLLTGVAPALSAAGVPAVVAMQLTVRTTAATRFSEVMYSALARGESVQRAVVQARHALYVEEADAASWYVPTLTIRARDSGPLYLFTGH